MSELDPALTNQHLQYNPNILDPIIMPSKPPPANPSNVVIDDSYEINDIRTPADFKGISFSKYKKTEVRKAFTEAMKKGKIEPACHWSAELICAGHFTDLWETILHYTAKHIHLGNPKVAIYLEMRYNVFRNIMSQGHCVSELDVRNDMKIRQLFAEIICTLSLSVKKPSIEPVKINRVEEFDMTQMTERLKANSMDFAQAIFQPKDPKELFIAINEFAYCLSPNVRNMMSACYWLEWIIEFEAICKKRKDPIFCVRRSQHPVDTKSQCDVIWLVWDAILLQSKQQKNSLITKTHDALARLFCIKYTTASCKKRRYLLYYAISLLTENASMNTEILPDRALLQNVVSKINEIYKQIKKNEEAPKTEYLFHGLDKKRALEKSLKQMELIGQIEQTRVQKPTSS
jgi:hypothetical protein